jgi:murein DD-endopeptidase MepM/ murein hydrolase activator NlpD
MKIYFSFLLGCLSLLVSAQENVKLFAEKKDKGYILYASSSEFCPVSLTIDLTLENFTFTADQQKVFIIPAKTDRFKLGELDVQNTRKGTRYSYHYTLAFGDINLKRYDTLYEYDLPYQKGKSFTIYQGYNGVLSHQNENSLDFSMSEGTEILAVRDGIVIKVVQNNNQSCPQEECKKYNNLIIIAHSDGTFAHYAHIRYNGSKVKPGDVVKKGDVIGYSGNTGWTNGPHLHFVCMLPGNDKSRTIMTKFKINDGTQSEYLKEKATYLRNY